MLAISDHVSAVWNTIYFFGISKRRDRRISTSVRPRISLKKSSFIKISDALRTGTHMGSRYNITPRILTLAGFLQMIDGKTPAQFPSGLPSLHAPPFSEPGTLRNTLLETNMETQKGPCKDYSPSKLELYGFPCSFGRVYSRLMSFTTAFSM